MNVSKDKGRDKIKDITKDIIKDLSMDRIKDKNKDKKIDINKDKNIILDNIKDNDKNNERKEEFIYKSEKKFHHQSVKSDVINLSKRNSRPPINWKELSSNESEGDNSKDDIKIKLNKSQDIRFEVRPKRARTISKNDKDSINEEEFYFMKVVQRKRGGEVKKKLFDKLCSQLEKNMKDNFVEENKNEKNDIIKNVNNVNKDEKEENKIEKNEKDENVINENENEKEENKDEKNDIDVNDNNENEKEEYNENEDENIQNSVEMKNLMNSAEKKKARIKIFKDNKNNSLEKNELIRNNFDKIDSKEIQKDDDEPKKDLINISFEEKEFKREKEEEKEEERQNEIKMQREKELEREKA